MLGSYPVWEGLLSPFPSLSPLLSLPLPLFLWSSSLVYSSTKNLQVFPKFSHQDESQANACLLLLSLSQTWGVWENPSSAPRDGKLSPSTSPGDAR